MYICTQICESIKRNLWDPCLSAPRGPVLERERERESVCVCVCKREICMYEHVYIYTSTYTYIYIYMDIYKYVTQICESIKTNLWDPCLSVRRGPVLERGEESRQCDVFCLAHTTHKSIWVNKSSVNPKSTSNQSSKPCTVLQYPSRKVPTLTKTQKSEEYRQWDVCFAWFTMNQIRYMSICKWSRLITGMWKGKFFFPRVFVSSNRWVCLRYNTHMNEPRTSWIGINTSCHTCVWVVSSHAWC